MTAIGKYWICKRACGHAAEAMECIGGSGVMEESPMQRNFRETPINAIWEGSGNVQCLNVLRALVKQPETGEVLFAEMEKARGGDKNFDHHTDCLKDDLKDISSFESRARNLMDRLAVGFQAATLIQNAPNFVADAFCASRLIATGAHQYGTLPAHCDQKAIMERASVR